MGVLGTAISSNLILKVEWRMLFLMELLLEDKWLTWNHLMRKLHYKLEMIPGGENLGKLLFLKIEDRRNHKREWNWMTREVTGKNLKENEIIEQEKKLFLEGISNQQWKILLRVWVVWGKKCIHWLDNVEDIVDLRNSIVWSVSCLKDEWKLKKIGLLVSFES